MCDENKRPAGTVVPSIWHVDVDVDGVRLTRLNSRGHPMENYARVSHARGAVWLAAIGQGFQPPRDVRPHEPEGPGGY